MVGNNDSPNTAMQAIPNLPIFHPDEEWLILAKKLLENAGQISNTAKFLAIYKSLPRDIQKDCKEMLQSNENNTFDILCEELKRRFEIPAHVKFQNMYTHETIGDRSPIQFLRDLRRKHSSIGVTNLEHLQFAFAQGLPEQYKPLVFSDIPDNLDAIAERIEKLHNVSKSSMVATNPCSFQMNSYSSSIPSGAIANMNSIEKEAQNMKDKSMLNEMRQTQLLEDLKETMTRMNQRLNEVESAISSTKDRPMVQYGQNIRSYPQRAMPQQKKTNYYKDTTKFKPNTNGFCKYHTRFGERSRNCVQPCNWRRQNNPLQPFNQGN